MVLPALFSIILALEVVRCSVIWNDVPAIPAVGGAKLYLLRGAYQPDPGSPVTCDPDTTVSGHRYLYRTQVVPVPLQYTPGILGYFRTGQDNTDPGGSQTINEGGVPSGDAISIYGQDNPEPSVNAQVGLKSGEGVKSDDSGESDVRPAIAQPEKMSDIPTGNAYSFSYDAKEHSRQESADDAGYVRGSFTFVAKDDGQLRTLEYEAGAGKGFLARGGHLPVAPTVAPVNEGTYRLSYETADQSREESADAGGFVKGSYSFVPRGETGRRRINYEAGPEKGFVASGDLSVTPDENLGGSPSVEEPGVRATSVDRPAQQPGLPAAISAEEEVAGSSAVPGGAGVEPSSAADSSYSFSYETSDQSREEFSDALGNVRGSFSFVAINDGIRRRVEYDASPTTGFRARGDHLPGSVPDVMAEPVPNISGEPADVSDGSGEQSRPDTRGQTEGIVPKGEGLPDRVDYETGPDTGSVADGIDLALPLSGSGTGNNDASYFYSYETDSSSKEERADASGDVVGSYSFVGGDGLDRNIRYTVKGGEGFVASGDILPRVPVDETAIDQDDSVSSSVAGNNLIVKTLIPTHVFPQFGYIYDAKH